MIAAILGVLIGAGLCVLGIYLALAEGLCLGQGPDCPDYPDAVVWGLILGGIGLAAFGLAEAGVSIWRWIRRR